MAFESLFQALDLQIQGDLDGAISLLAEQVDALVKSGTCNEELPILTHDLVMLYERTGRTQVAIEYLRKCLALCPDDLCTLYGLARLLLSTGRRDEGRILAQRLHAACESSSHEFRHGWAELATCLEPKNPSPH